ncbi:hypothetical protein GIB67_018839, partial [Kingdonia uniflora]
TMKSDSEVNEQFEEENQMQESGAKKSTSNAKNYTTQYTGLGLHKMFTVLPEEEKEDVLRLNLLKIILSFLLPNKGRNVWVKYVDLADDLDQFNRFPYGEQVYNFLWSQIMEFAHYRSAAGKKSDKALSLHGCTWVLIIWTFLSILSLKFPRMEESIHLFPKLQG